MIPDESFFLRTDWIEQISVCGLGSCGRARDYSLLYCTWQSHYPIITVNGCRRGGGGGSHFSYDIPVQQCRMEGGIGCSD